MSHYVPIVILAALAAFFAVFSLVMGSLSGPKRWNRAKLEAYECGIEPTRQPTGLRFPVKYYLTAMLFIVFDIEIIFLDRKSTRLNSSHSRRSRMPSSA